MSLTPETAITVRRHWNDWKAGAVLLRRLTPAFFVLLGLCCPAQAITGNDLHRFCTEPGTRNLAYIYTTGVIDDQMVRVKATNAPPLFCLAEGVTGVRVGDVICRYVEVAPSERHYEAAALALLALRKAWPCAQP